MVILLGKLNHVIRKKWMKTIVQKSGRTFESRTMGAWEPTTATSAPGPFRGRDQEQGPFSGSILTDGKAELLSGPLQRVYPGEVQFGGCYFARATNWVLRLSTR